MRSLISAAASRALKSPLTRLSTPPPHSIPALPAHLRTHKMSTSTNNPTLLDPSQTQWAHPPSTHDLRSDTLTTPPLTMLASLVTPHLSLGDAIYAESTTTSTFSSRLAALFNKPAATYVISGTMGNLCSLRALLSHYPSPYSVAMDVRSHVWVYEAGGLAEVAGAWPVGFDGRGGLRGEVQQCWVDGDGHFSRTRVLSLENTVNGEVVGVEEVREVTAWVRERGGRCHLDGARLWEAVCSGMGGWDRELALRRLREYVECFDTVTVCFSKGLGAPVGSYVLGSEEDVGLVERYRKQVGGDGRQVGVLTSMMEVGLEEQFLGGRLWEVQRRVREVDEFWRGIGGSTTCRTETNMVWVDLGQLGVSEEEWIEIGKRRGLKVGERLVFHFQVTDEAYAAVKAAMKDLMEYAKNGTVDGKPLTQGTNEDGKGSIYGSK